MDQSLELLIDLAHCAGKEILHVREKGASVEWKADDSPVTEADRRAEEIILNGLRAEYPDIAIVAEEEASAGAASETAASVFFLVDPLDGTKEFVNGGEDFTVNIALVRHGSPVIGVVHVPVTGVTFVGSKKGAKRITDGQFETITCCKPQNPLRIVASKSHRTAETDDWISKIEAEHGHCEIVSVGSSLKFCLLADGTADLYPRFGRTMEWDTAAGDAVLRAAGGMTFFTNGDAFRYGKEANWNGQGDVAFANSYFIASGENRKPL
jgi:3'(2'), 5'-bisphosphate nucleotidase